MSHTVWKDSRFRKVNGLCISIICSWCTVTFTLYTIIMYCPCFGHGPCKSWDGLAGKFHNNSKETFINQNEGLHVWTWIEKDADLSRDVSIFTLFNDPMASMLLMKEILHRWYGKYMKISQFSFVHPSWCSISSMNNTSNMRQFSKHVSFFVALLMAHQWWRLLVAVEL